MDRRYDEAIDRLTQSLNDLQMSQQQLRDAGSSAVLRYKAHMQRVAQLQSKNDRCYAQLQTLQTKYDELLEQLGNTNAQEEIDALIQERDKLRQQLESLSQRIVETDKVITDQQAILEDAKNQFDTIRFTNEPQFVVPKRDRSPAQYTNSRNLRPRLRNGNST